MFQHTIGDQIIFEGYGLHTGKPAILTLKPAQTNTGFRFCRTDLPNKPIVEALAQWVTDTTRSTTLEKEGVKIRTTEHLLAALIGANLDNVLIEIDNEEIPILDGSSKLFLEEILKVETVQQAAHRQYLEVQEEQYYDSQNGSIIRFIPSQSGGLSLSVTTDFESLPKDIQKADLESLNYFEEQIAPCRTFCFLSELQLLLKANLIRGGSLDNAIVIIDKELANEEKELLEKSLGQKDIVIHKDKKILNDKELRFENEPTRHKLLDLIGDLALVGKHLRGHIIAQRPGHTVNTHFAKILASQETKTNK
jgi:UDP-3-O-[3-hydroxymyristoyl] N-acetylglucosamine deacetylase / 3-hydroxyacyl-[acyl-carrier-protein] dehydratase